MEKFKYLYDSKQMSWLLSYAACALVRDDLDFFGVPGMTSHLELLYRDRGVGHELDLEVDFFPVGTDLVGTEIAFVVIRYTDADPGQPEAALYSYDEFRAEIVAQLERQSADDPVLSIRASQIKAKHHLF